MLVWKCKYHCVPVNPLIAFRISMKKVSAIAVPFGVTTKSWFKRSGACLSHAVATWSPTTEVIVKTWKPSCGQRSQTASRNQVSYGGIYTSLIPRPLPSFHTASDGKLGEGLGTRLDPNGHCFYYDVVVRWCSNSKLHNAVGFKTTQICDITCRVSEKHAE